MPKHTDTRGIIVIDNGSDTIKCGFSNQLDPSIVMSNNTARIKKSMHELIGDEIHTKVVDHSQLFYKRPFQNGYLVDWETEGKVWRHLFDNEHMNINPHECSLYMNDPPLNMYQIRKNTIEVIFEYYQFNSFMTSPTSLWSIQRGKDLNIFHNRNIATGTYLVIDSGFSYTHILPYINNKLVLSGIQRIDIGGKLLTNYFKDIISHRYFDIQSNTYIANEIKENMCYMSTDFMTDINQDIKKNSHFYVLPDYISIMKGYSTDDPRHIAEISAQNGQFIPLSTELFSLPELLIHPSDMGIKESGIPETISHCLKQFPEAIQEHLSSAILFMGGNTKFRNFQERMNMEIPSYISSDSMLNIQYLNDPILDPWRGGASLANSSFVYDNMTDILTYDEEGPERVMKSIYELSIF